MSSTDKEKQEILRTAESLVCGDRANEYGPPQTNFGNIADGWSVIAGVDINARQVALMMGWLKICRLVNTPNHKDSLIDLAGYAACANACDEVG